jgi:hypothetical protein
VNYGPPDGEVRFTDVVLGDCGSTVRADSRWAREGHWIGASIFRSPEAFLQVGWGTATDIWSFGTMASFTISYALLLIPLSIFTSVVACRDVGLVYGS